MTVKRKSLEPNDNDLKRFWSKVNKDGPTIINNSPCWIWIGFISRGYGQFSIGKPLHYSHRLSWQFENGPIPKTLKVCHRCDNKLCVRPDHLFLGTNKDNMKDASKKNRCGSQSKPENTPRGSKHKDSKLTEDLVVLIRSLWLDRTCKEIAELLGVHSVTINKVRLYKNYKHVEVPIYEDVRWEKLGKLSDDILSGKIDIKTKNKDKITYHKGNKKGNKGEITTTDLDKENFYRNVNKTDTCWLWMKSIRSSGYGAYMINYVPIDAHRYSWILNVGQIADKIQVCHKCKNKLCVNPTHLFLAKHYLKGDINK